MKNFLVSSLVFLSTLVVVHAQPASTSKAAVDTIPAELSALFAKEMSSAKYAVRAWITDQSSAVKASSRPVNQVLEASHAAISRRFAGQSTSKSDELTIIFLIVRQAIADIDEDKRYFLVTLERLNETAEALDEQLEELADASKKLADEEATPCADPTCTSIRARVDRLVAQVRAAEIKGVTFASTETVGGLQASVRELDAVAEEVRSQRDRFKAKLEAAERRRREVYDMLVTIVKQVAEIRAGSVKHLK